VNILYVNYGDFTTNSLNHITGFANSLCAAGHACVVAVPQGKETITVIPQPLFIAAEFSELLARPGIFPDGRPADLIHAWTPRERVRRFVLAYQRTAHARLIVHLEDNEEHLLAAWLGRAAAGLAEISEAEFGAEGTLALSHPRRHRQFLRSADGVTVIVESLRQFVPPEVATVVLPPGVDFSLYRPSPPSTALRSELGLGEGERVLVLTGSNTFANEPEMRDLYVAVHLLNHRGLPTRLIRTGHNTPTFQAGLSEALTAHVLDLGFVDKAKLPALLALADALVQPGRPGPFNDFRLPSKLPEYFAMGRPVVLPAANVGLETRDGVDALVLKTGTPEEIADACQRLFQDPGLAQKLGQNALAFAHRHFNLADNSRHLAEFYRQVLTAAPAPGSTATLTGDESEITLGLRRLAARAADPEAAAVAADLAPLVAELEHGYSGETERLRLEKEAEEWRRGNALSVQHSAHLQEQLQLTQNHARNLEEELKQGRQHAAHLEDKLRLGAQHAVNLEEKLELSAQHSTHLEEKLKLGDQHGQNLGRELADARGRLQRLEGKYAISEKLLTSTRRQLDALDAEFDTEITAARKKISETDELLRLSRQHGTNLENLRTALQRRIGELDAQCDHLTRTIGARDDVIGQLRTAEAKLATLQRSFSWQATLPLRFLRRLLLDPWRRRPKSVTASPEATAVTFSPALPASADPAEVNPAPASSAAPAAPPALVPPPTPLAIYRSVDNPQSWSLPPRKTLLRGWCFAEDGRKLTGVRAVLPDRSVAGVYGYKRLDVFASVRGKPQSEYCGWQIELELTAADTLLDLEVADDNSLWHPFFHTALKIGEGLGPLDLTRYERWIEVYDRQTAETFARQAEESANFARRPVISVLMPVYNTDERWLRRALDSVRAQTYPHWELCIADDASPAPHIRPFLEQASREDPRIKVVFREENGHISAASNSALALASGEYLALLDHDDELAPHALYEVAAVLNVHPDADYLFSDEDKIDENGRRHEPYFKPDWLPDLFLGQNYTSHLSVYRAERVRGVGGFRRGYEGSQDWDLTLRVMDETTPDRIVHIPKILYHWRAIPGSTALQLSEKNYPVEAARRALADHFQRRHEAVELIPVPGDHWRIKRLLPSTPPAASIVIPTRNRLELLRPCVESIQAKTTYPDYEIIIVDNQSDDPAILAWFAELQESDRAAPGRRGRVRVLHHDAPFNFSAICNQGVAAAQGTLIALLNNDLEAITPDWLEEMVSQALRPEIGCVGAMLYYPNDTIQHAGVILGVGGVAGHAFRDFPRGTEGRFNRARLAQNYSAVTAACLVVRKSVYLQVGGFDEDTLAVAFNDIDFCLKVSAAGYRNLWTPYAEFYHHESASRGVDDTPEKAARFQLEVELMLRRWGPALQHDPAYNPNLTLELNDFSLASPPRPAPPVGREGRANGQHLRELWPANAGTLDRLGTPGTTNGAA